VRRPTESAREDRRGRHDGIGDAEVPTALLVDEEDLYVLVVAGRRRENVQSWCVLEENMQRLIDLLFLLGFMAVRVGDDGGVNGACCSSLQ
jgi:hypothetical protein